MTEVASTGQQQDFDWQIGLHNLIKERALNMPITKTWKTFLEAQAMPQAIDAALELADCFALQGEINEALALILPAVEHPASTDVAKSRAQELMLVIEKQVALRDIEKMVKPELMEAILTRFSS